MQLPPFEMPDSPPDATQAIPQTDTERTQMVGAAIGTTQAIVPIQCPVCRQINPAAEAYCAECGFLLSSAQPAATAAEPSPLPILRDASGREFLLNEGSNIIGRDAADVLLSDSRVSRRHAELIIEADTVTITDLGSTNGTKANGARLEQNATVGISSGAQLEFGGLTMELVIPDEWRTAAPAETASVPAANDDIALPDANVELRAAVIGEIRTILNAPSVPQDEANTREWVVIPLIYACGYARYDIASHAGERESPHPDYTVLPRTDYAWELVVKRWREPITDEDGETARDVARERGVRWIALTNGGDWELHDSEAGECARTTVLEHEEDAALFFVALAKSEVTAGRLGGDAISASETPVEVAPPTEPAPVGDTLTGFFLLNISDPVLNQRFELTTASKTVGRRSDCDIVVANPYVSGRHAEVGVTNGVAWVTDVGSTNGTTVNGAAIAEGAMTTLAPGDEVVFGQARFRLEASEESQ